MRTLRSRQASVLVIILVTLVFTTTALLLFIERASDDLLLPTRDADARRLRVEAYSALETTIAVLEEFRLVNGSLRSPAEGWGNPLEFAGYEVEGRRTVEVTFIDESGKLSLPTADEKLLKDLFESWKLSPNAAEKLTESLLTWMQKDYHAVSAGVTSAEDYGREAVPFRPPGRPLRTWAELASIDGVREAFYDEEGALNELGRKFTAAFSLYQYDSPNVNAAQPDTLAVLGEYDELQRGRIRDYVTGAGSYATRGAGFFRDPGDVSQVASGTSTRADYGTEIQALWVVVTVREGQAFFQVRALVAPPGGASVPPPAVATDENGNPQEPAAAAPESADTQVAESLNYPFTVLEIRENDTAEPIPAQAENP